MCGLNCTDKTIADKTFVVWPELNWSDYCHSFCGLLAENVLKVCWSSSAQKWIAIDIFQTEYLTDKGAESLYLYWLTLVMSFIIRII